MGNKPLSELTIKDNFMFAAVMSNPANCKPLLEMILEIEIDFIEISYEKSIIYNPQYRGIRLDVFAKDDKGSHYNIEMQVQKDHILKRSRYYHSHMDMEFITTKTDYSKLPESYVIFICDFDPFGCGRFKYSTVSHFKEVPKYVVDDGNHSIYLSTKGINNDEVPANLVRFLNFVHAPLDKSSDNFHDSYVEQLQDAIARVKNSREMGSRYMLFEELLREEHEEGRREGHEEGRKEGLSESIIKAKNLILDTLSMLSPVNTPITEIINNVQDLDLLNKLILIAARSESLEQFSAEYKKLM